MLFFSSLFFYNISFNNLGAPVSPIQASSMIMDGLDTLSRVALSEHHSFHLSFDTYKPALSSFVSVPSPCPRGAEYPDSTGDTTDDTLNTPVTTNSDLPSFFGSEPTVYSDPVPITGEYLLLFYFDFSQLGGFFLSFLEERKKARETERVRVI